MDIDRIGLCGCRTKATGATGNSTPVFVIPSNIRSRNQRGKWCTVITFKTQTPGDEPGGLFVSAFAQLHRQCE